jgi:hypothetical protein
VLLTPANLERLTDLKIEAVRSAATKPASPGAAADAAAQAAAMAAAVVDAEFSEVEPSQGGRCG